MKEESVPFSTEMPYALRSLMFSLVFVTVRVTASSIGILMWGSPCSSFSTSMCIFFIGTSGQRKRRSRENKNPPKKKRGRGKGEDTEKKDIFHFNRLYPIFRNDTNGRNSIIYNLMGEVPEWSCTCHKISLAINLFYPKKKKKKVRKKERGANNTLHDYSSSQHTSIITPLPPWQASAMTPSPATRLDSLVAVSFPFSRSHAVAAAMSLWFSSKAVEREVKREGEED